ncbi:MAG: hypothetical protein LAQ30_01060 [Acidobacteriia bacterium]|nr:hypothetical protein [Terriglobia bacterium]
MKRGPGPALWLYGLSAAIAAALLVSAQTTAFTWDEGFHLLAAQLITTGREPYLDFCFPQTPLTVYWNAAWMLLFGDTWRTAHALSALLTATAVLLAADYVLRRIPAPRWALAGAAAAALFFGLNDAVFEFGTLGQAYGMCLIGTVAAFRCAVAAVDRKPWAAAAGAGFFTGVAMASSLLTAAAPPVLLLWMVLRNRAGSRWAKAAAFAAGAAIPFAPVFRLLLKGPRQTLFNVIQYQLHHRVANWPDATQHDWEIFTSWVNSGPALLLGILALAGLYWARTGKEWNDGRRSELYLCGWLAAALGFEAATAHPTFARYFLLTVPFLAILAGVGFCGLATRLAPAVRPLWPGLALGALLCLGWGRGIYDRRDVYTWADLVKVAQKVREATPPGAALWAEEPIYFLLRRTPPPGMEFAYSHTVEGLTPQQERELHIITRAEIKRQVEAGAYHTVETCDPDTEFMASLGLEKLYRHKVELVGCAVYW